MNAYGKVLTAVPVEGTLFCEVVLQQDCCESNQGKKDGQSGGRRKGTWSEADGLFIDIGAQDGQICRDTEKGRNSKIIDGSKKGKNRSGSNCGHRQGEIDMV